MSTPFKFMGYGTKPYAPRVDPAVWESLKPLVSELTGEGLTKSDILKALESQHDFRPTEKQLRAQMQAWGMVAVPKRNLTDFNGTMIAEDAQEPVDSSQAATVPSNGVVHENDEVEVQHEKNTIADGTSAQEPLEDVCHDDFQCLDLQPETLKVLLPHLRSIQSFGLLERCQILLVLGAAISRLYSPLDATGIYRKTTIDLISNKSLLSAWDMEREEFQSHFCASSNAESPLAALVSLLSNLPSSLTNARTRISGPTRLLRWFLPGGDEQLKWPQNLFKQIFQNAADRAATLNLLGIELLNLAFSVEYPKLGFREDVVFECCLRTRSWPIVTWLVARRFVNVWSASNAVNCFLLPSLQLSDRRFILRIQCLFLHVWVRTGIFERFDGLQNCTDEERAQLIYIWTPQIIEICCNLAAIMVARVWSLGRINRYLTWNANSDRCDRSLRWGRFESVREQEVGRNAVDLSILRQSLSDDSLVTETLEMVLSDAVDVRSQCSLQEPRTPGFNTHAIEGTGDVWSKCRTLDERSAHKLIYDEFVDHILHITAATRKELRHSPGAEIESSLTIDFSSSKSCSSYRTSSTQSTDTRNFIRDARRINGKGLTHHRTSSWKKNTF